MASEESINTAFYNIETFIKIWGENTQADPDLVYGLMRMDGDHYLRIQDLQALLDYIKWLEKK